jgi:hypothetical protein
MVGYFSSDTLATSVAWSINELAKQASKGARLPSTYVSPDASRRTEHGQSERAANQVLLYPARTIIPVSILFRNQEN